jgi:hypothetical protein
MIDIATVDVESFWSADYSLSKLSPLEYVLDDQWELQFMSLKMNDERTAVAMGEDEIRYMCKQVDWKKVMALGHNMAGFDAYVLAYRLGINPRMWGCTLAMARPIHAKTVGLSLAKLAAHYGVGFKNNAVLVQTRGRRLSEFTPEEITKMRIYNGEDSDQCRGIFKPLLRHYTTSELWQIDCLIRMRTEPAFRVNTSLLETAASAERSRKYASLLKLAGALGITYERLTGDEEWDNSETQRIGEDTIVEHIRSELASAPKFSALLEKLGVEVPMKEGKPDKDGNKRMIPALAKTDEEFIALQDHENDLVATAAMARLDVKSTLLETRIQKFRTAAALTGGFLPVPIRFCGADTTGRDSGEEYNMQNLPRINKKKPAVSDCLRNCIEAPPGYEIIVADQSGIELRVNHFLWQVHSSMELFRADPEKADLYRKFAAELYGIAPEEIDPPQRQLGKVSQLGLGFGAGAFAFRRVARNMGGIILPLTEAEAKGQLSAEQIVRVWRTEYPEIAGREGGWKRAARAVLDIARGIEADVDPWGLVHTCKEGFVLPSGRLIRYPELREEADGEWPDGRPKTSWFYGHGRHKARITGPKAVENMVQAIGRDSIFDASINYYKSTGLRPKLRVHDELVYVVPKENSRELLAELQRELRTSPKWWPQLVVWSEGSTAKTYGSAK